MRKATLLLITVVIFIFTGCCSVQTSHEVNTAQDAENLLCEKNKEYISLKSSNADISQQRRIYTAENGQSPYAVIVTCSDSRVPPEHIFNAGIGDLFVIRTAGNVVGDYELGSIEYGVEHVGAKLVVVLGHTQCGAIEAALSGGVEGNIKSITDEICSCLPENCEAKQAERLNVQNSIEKIKTSTIMQEFMGHGNVELKGAIYDISTGEVEFLD